MARQKSRSALRAVALVAAAAAVLAVVRPWTVRPLVTAAPVFDAAKFAGDAWPRILAEASRSAVEISAAHDTDASPAAAAAPGRRSAFVKFTGTLTAIDRQSRVGLARVRVAPGPRGEVAIQVGPVIRGTALRDATSFIRFNDFANQFEFAAVSNALHELVLRDVVGAVDLDALTGKSIAVVGATTLRAGMPQDQALDVVPIRLQVVGGGR